MTPVVHIVRGLIVLISATLANMKDVKVRFGEAVRRIRSKRGLSQEELAHLSGLDRSYIGGVERGERNPSVVAIESIAKGFGITISELFLDLSVENDSPSRSVGDND